MLILVYGDDTFRVQEKVKELQVAFQRKFDPTGLNFGVFGSDAKPGDMLQAVGSLPFMSQKRMVVVRDLISSTKKDGEQMWLSLSKTPESSILVLWETMEAKAIEKKPLFQTLSKGADVHAYPFPVLEGSSLVKWTTDRVKARGGTITQDAARELCERVGGDLWQMDNEIGKLVAYARRGAGLSASGGNPPIAKIDVEELVRASFEGEIFALVDAVSRKQAELAVKLLRQERWSGTSDFSIFGMLTRQVRILIAVRSMLDEDPRVTSQRLAQEMGVHPFVAQKALDQARKYLLDDLLATHDILFKYDAGMKSGYLDAELAVDLVVARLVR